ncbi:MAG TPA: carboxypeptidase-like regulatory domain-containing protein, partial [Gaiellaceae bacterium]
GVGYDGPFDLVPGGTASRTVTLVAPVPPPAGVSITERGTTSDGIPVVSVHNPATLTATGCANGSASYTITRGSVQLASGSMAESPPGSGNYLAGGVVPPPGDENGPATVTISIACGTDTQTIAFDIVYLDPSGVVVDQNGNPVAGATVTLLTATSPDGPFTAVPDGSPLMSPDNRRNSDTTAADGTFGWDVVAGFYKVEATAPGCAPAQTGLLTVPPPVTGLVLKLDCNVDTTPPAISKLTASPNVLWPADHKLVPVTITATATDNVDPSPTCAIASVTSSEPVDGLGDGDTSPDWILTGPLTLQLRAERSGTGPGRTYTITVACKDAAGNSSHADVTVTVPHNAPK